MHAPIFQLVPENVYEAGTYHVVTDDEVFDRVSGTADYVQDGHGKWTVGDIASPGVEADGDDALVFKPRDYFGARTDHAEELMRAWLDKDRDARVDSIAQFYDPLRYSLSAALGDGHGTVWVADETGFCSGFTDWARIHAKEAGDGLRYVCVAVFDYHM